MYQYYLNLGISVGKNYLNIEGAIDFLKRYRGTKFLYSDFYMAARKFCDESKDDGEFLVVAICMDSDHHPFDFYKKIKKVERKFPDLHIDIVWIENIELVSSFFRVPNYELLETAYSILPLQEVVKTDIKLLKYINSKIEMLREEGKRISKYHLKRM